MRGRMSGPLMDAAAQWLPELLPGQVITGPSSHVDFTRIFTFKVHVWHWIQSIVKFLHTDASLFRLQISAGPL